MTTSLPLALSVLFVNTLLSSYLSYKIGFRAGRR